MARQAALGPENDVRLYSKHPQVISGVWGWVGGEWVFLFIMRALLVPEKDDYFHHEQHSFNN